MPRLIHINLKFFWVKLLCQILVNEINKLNENLEDIFSSLINKEFEPQNINSFNSLDETNVNINTNSSLGENLSFSVQLGDSDLKKYSNFYNSLNNESIIDINNSKIEKINQDLNNIIFKCSNWQSNEIKGILSKFPKIILWKMYRKFKN